MWRSVGHSPKSREMQGLRPRRAKRNTTPGYRMKFEFEARTVVDRWEITTRILDYCTHVAPDITHQDRFREEQSGCRG